MIGGKYRIIYATMIMVLLICLAAYLYLSLDLLLQENNRVTVFIIDSGFNDNNGHGHLVREVINREAGLVEIIELDIATTEGYHSKELYLNALYRILNYQQLNPQKTILVNISLAFSDKGFQQSLIERLTQEGVLIIAAAGNDNSNQPVYPAGFKAEVLAVASATLKGKDLYSNYGDFVDISAPGSYQYTEFLPGSYSRRYRLTGTSFAAPRVTGLLARVFNLNPELDKEGAVAILEKTADPLPTGEVQLGAGVINKTRLMSIIDNNYFIKERLKQLILINAGLVIMLFLWARFKVISIFIMALLGLFFLPLLLVITAYLPRILYWIRARGVSYYELMVSLVLLALGWLGLKRLFYSCISRSSNIKFLFSLRQFPAMRVKEIAAKRLLVLATIDSTWVKDALSNRPHYRDYILEYMLKDQQNDKSRKQLTENEKEQLAIELLPLMLEFLQSSDSEKKELAVRVLSEFKAELILAEMKGLFHCNKVDNYHVLELIATFGTAASTLKEEVISIIRASDDMWIRYQALLTLNELDNGGEDFLAVARVLQNDSQELVRMEAEYHLQDQ